MKFTKTIRQLICPLLAALLLCSCQTDRPEAKTTAPEDPVTDTLTTPAKIDPDETSGEGMTSTESSEATEETYILIDYTEEHYAPYHIMNYFDPLLIRWDDIIEDSVTTQPYLSFKDENGNWVVHDMDFIAVKVTILKAYIDTHPYLQHQVEDRPDQLDLFTNERFRHVWIPCQYLDMVTEGEQAIVMLQAFDADMDLMPKRLASVVNAYPPFYHAFDLNMNPEAHPSMIPITNGALQLRKDEEQPWCYEIQLLQLYNGWLDEEKITDAPLFRDGMTLEEFDQMIDLIRQYVKR